jgi:hypothetical protein
MSATYSESVYTWNHYDGDSPSMDSIGLPLDYSGADLPTSIPDADGMTVHEMAATSQVPYSPGLMEMGGASSATPASGPATVQGTPAKPGLWKAVGQAIFGGSVGVSKTNSTAAVTSGENTTLSTAS